MPDIDAKTLRAVFGRSVRPTIPFTLADVPAEARKLAGKLSISGVQPKLSVRLEGDSLVSVAEGGQYILKPQTAEFPELPQNEDLCMRMGRRFGLSTAPCVLLELSDGSPAYVVRRFDRFRKGRRVGKLACEDMHQVLGGPDKYAGSHEQLARAIAGHCRFPPLELQRLFELTAFNFAVGNGDAHRKNFSLLTGRDGVVALSPAYDLVSSRLVIPEESAELALTLNGRRNRLSQSDFLAFAAHVGTSVEYAKRRLLDLVDLEAEYLRMIGESALSAPLRGRLVVILRGRMARLRDERGRRGNRNER